MMDQISSLLDAPISVFKSPFDTTPEATSTLRRLVMTAYYKSQVEEIRAESNPENQRQLKNRLRAFSPVAYLNHREENTTWEAKIIQQHAMMAVDIDSKDNPTVDMAALKQKISELRYVLLCAYSVRGGLWCVISLPNNQTPETLAGHFRYIQWLFSKQFGIKLDSTKGSNPCALRFTGYNPEPYLNDWPPDVMDKSYTPEPQRRTFVPTQPIDEDQGELLRRLRLPVESAGDGQRHESLLKSARVAGGLYAAGRLDEETAILALESIASNWPNFEKSKKTIRDGFNHGSREPIFPETRPSYAPRPAPVRSPALHAYRGDGLQSFDVPAIPKPSEPLADTVSVEVDSRPRFVQADGSVVYGEVLDFVTPDAYPETWDEVVQEIAQAEPSESNYSPLAAIDVARIDWLMHVRPPQAWDRIEMKRAFLACVAPIDEPIDVPALTRLHDLHWRQYARPPKRWNREAARQSFKTLVDHYIKPCDF